MIETITLPPFPILQKPKLGEPCNGCGWCCHEEICLAGKVFLEMGSIKEVQRTFVKGPCPLMRFEDNKVRCWLVQIEAKMEWEPITANALGIGKGCDADDPQSYKGNFRK